MALESAHCSQRRIRITYCVIDSTTIQWRNFESSLEVWHLKDPKTVRWKLVTTLWTQCLQFSREKWEQIKSINDQCLHTNDSPALSLIERNCQLNDYNARPESTHRSTWLTTQLSILVSALESLRSERSEYFKYSERLKHLEYWKCWKHVIRRSIGFAFCQIIITFWCFWNHSKRCCEICITIWNLRWINLIYWSHLFVGHVSLQKLIQPIL